MTSFHRRFLPDRLRPRAPRRRVRRRFPAAFLAVSAAMLLVASAWKVESVEVSGVEVVPVAVASSLEGLVGHAVVLLDLEWARWVAATWPAAGEVRVRLDLPGTVVVEIFPAAARGSVAVGRGWHAVAADGRFAGPLCEPVAPRLDGFRRPTDRRLAFAVARRLSEECSGTVDGIRQVTPADYRVELKIGESELPAVVHVAPMGTEAERALCELARGTGAEVVWADLRWPNRMVLREVG